MLYLFLIAGLAAATPRAVTDQLLGQEDVSTLLKRKLTPDNTCGGTTNGYTCDPSISNGGPCCSKNGFCGKTSAYCNAGCQWSFSNPGCNYTAANTCGGTNGYTCSPTSPNGGSCCSSQGFCGYTVAYCGSGCQGLYGSCFGTSAPAIARGANAYEVPGVGTFTTFKNYTFATDSSLTNGVDLQKSTGTVNAGKDDPYSHSFTTANVAVANGFLQLTVPGGQNKSPIQCGQINTVQKKILYGSVRTYAQFSSVPGTCHGLFFYFSDTQEIDIEYLTDPNSRSNPGDGTKILQYTNQANDGNSNHSTHDTSPSPTDATTTIHEYRIDWIPGKAMFYLDGVLQKTFTANVPTQAGEWIWNNWSSGNIGFTAGPPTSTNTLLIKNIVMYYNVSAT